MKKWWIIIGALVIVAVLGVIFGPRLIGYVGQNMLGGGPSCSVAPGEWSPGKGECPGITAEMEAKCNEFCAKHPDCCGDREEGGEFGGREKTLDLPPFWQIMSLKRNYQETIKALNEGPNIYSRSLQKEIISDEKLEAVKAAGFNTIQVLLIGKMENGKLVFNDVNNSVLLNDIVAIKKHGLAVWVALDVAGVPTSGPMSLGEYDEFKDYFLDFTKKSAELMEKYKVEYLTASNEPDKPFREQKNWSVAEINANLIDFFPAVSAAAREKFSGKMISKITQTRKHPQAVVEASFKNVDIAGVDVGPPMDGRMSFADYQKSFDEYQFFASLAASAGVPWMNAEYWQGDFEGYGQFAQSNELKYARVSFDAYLKVAPKGQGYVWNDWATFSLPQGETTKQAITDFFKKF